MHLQKGLETKQIRIKKGRWNQSKRRDQRVNSYPLTHGGVH